MARRKSQAFAIAATDLNNDEGGNGAGSAGGGAGGAGGGAGAVDSPPADPHTRLRLASSKELLADAADTELASPRLFSTLLHDFQQLEEELRERRESLSPRGGSG